eukprot:1195221-Prorocentrum_minimum.AAC.6
MAARLGQGIKAPSSGALSPSQGTPLIMRCCAGGKGAAEAANEKVVLVCDVVVGRPHEATENIERCVSPPDGSDSVWGKPGNRNLKFEEFVVYDNHAALPRYLIFY